MIGAGLIGRAWAMVFARAGWRVRLHDSDATQLAGARRLIAQVSPSSKRRDSSTTPRRPSSASTHVRARRRARRMRLGAGEPARGRRDQACGVRRARRRRPRTRCSRAPRRRSSLRSSPKNSPSRSLPRRASGQSAASRAGGRAVRRAVDISAATLARAREVDDRASARCRYGAPRDRRLRAQSPAGRAADGGDAAGRRGLHFTRGSRQDGRRRPRPALVVHGTVRHDRAQRTGGVPDYCARYSGFYRRLAAAPRRRACGTRESRGARRRSARAAAVRDEREPRTRLRDRRLLALRAPQARHELRFDRQEDQPPWPQPAKSSSPVRSPARSTRPRCRRTCR